MDIECTVCGGNNFHKESGFFYCNECQTQSQEIQEHVFQDDRVDVKKTKKISNARKAKIEKEITSWECWNVILGTLSNELIKHGAKKQLKNVVKCLWMMYLQKLEVVSIDADVLPKVQVVRSKRDIQILYGRVKKKKRSRSTSEDESNTRSTTLDDITNPSSAKRERARKKQALVQSHYKDFSQRSTQESSSLHNETLTSLKSESEKSATSSSRGFTYNKYAHKELRKHFKRCHLKRHVNDHLQELTCHKINHKSVTYGYKSSVKVITQLKIYSILYLALLIIKDDIQLGDLLRFLREGHVSFNYFTHLFSEEYCDKFLNISSYSRHTDISHSQMRTTTAELASFLNVSKYVEVPNLVKLGERFCKELNLPKALFHCYKSLLSITKPALRLRQCRKNQSMPNYEARVIAMILFIVKLLFGLDGETEFHFSTYATLLNKKLFGRRNMFDVITWLKHLQYRRLVISEHHFPTQYLADSKNVNSDYLLGHLHASNVKFHENNKLCKEMEDYKQLLLKIQNVQSDIYVPIEFEASLTPFYDYTKKIVEEVAFKKSNAWLDLLENDFTGLTLDHILKPDKYLLLLTNDREIVVRNRGANENWRINPIQNPRMDATMKNRRDRKIVTVKVSESDNLEILNATTPVNKGKSNEIIDTDQVLLDHDINHSEQFKITKAKINKLSQSVDLNIDTNCSFKDEDGKYYDEHFNPFERYWMNFQMNIDWSSRHCCRQFLSKHPQSFQILFHECSRIVEQNEKQMFYEFEMTELYLVYYAKYDWKTHAMPKNSRLSQLVKQAHKNW